MANKTIPQLPLQTGITDNDLLAIVDSGETTTSKIKLSTLLSGVGGGAFQVGDATDSIVPGYSPTSRGVSGSTTYVDKLNIEGEVSVSNTNETFILNSDNTTITDHPYNRVFAGHGNSKISSTNSTGANILIGTLQGVISNGSYNVMVGMGEISAAGFGNGMFGTNFQSKITSGNYNAIVGGEDNDCLGSNGNGVVGGRVNRASGGASFIGGGISNTITALESAIAGAGGSTINGIAYNFIGGGQSNTNSARWSAIVGADSCQITGQRSFVAGAHDSDITNGPRFSTIVGGWQHTNSSVGDSNQILGGNANIINDTGGQTFHSTIMQGSNQVISNGENSVIVGGSNNTLAGGTNVVMLGCSGRTSTSNYTTYVETLEAFDGIVMTDYANLDFASDAAAATGGVPLGGVYHNSGDMKIRIT